MKKHTIITVVISFFLFLYTSCNGSDEVIRKYRMFYTVSIRYTDNTLDTINGNLKYTEGEDVDFDLYAADRPSACLGINGKFVACYVKTYSVLERRIVEIDE